MNRIAILMPAYNEGARLYATLDALRKHTDGRFAVHVFLVDDGGALVEEILNAIARD